MNVKQQALDIHKKYRGKIEITTKMPLNNPQDLSLAYTPGVAQPCIEIERNPDNAYQYTAKGNLVAVVTDGTAVLGLGDIGALAAIPVMEGKAALFKRFGGVDAVPICLDTRDTEEIIKIVKSISPCFGGINLEDISSPRCFEIERRLDEELNIPVFHDDQHGTAVVVTAALINAARLTNRRLETLKVVLNGPGSAGTAIIRMLISAGVKDIVACDEYGILFKERSVGIVDHKEALCAITNSRGLRGGLTEALCGADVFIGVSVKNVLTPQMVSQMACDPIVFAMANPDPEIAYETAMDCGIRVMGTGRSDYPNQINNVLVFPGIFRGALDVAATTINDEMKIAAAYAIADLVTPEELTPEYIVPSSFDPRVKAAVASAVSEAAKKSGVARLLL